ncbi:MAG: UMP kinase [Bacteroidales bacterium]|jgi:uridylate kinase|nr:UMP kinase [Bacteroidales bacterium]
MLKYKRILLKLSGESLQGDDGHGIDPHILNDYAQEVKDVVELGVEVGIVIGGGNIYRGLKGQNQGFDRVKGDYMGMLATVINALALQSSLECIGVRSRVMTAVCMEPIGEAYSKLRMEHALSQKEVVIFGAGTGNPFFTTDTAAALRANEMGADVLLKGTRVDGVYSADPEKDSNAEKYKSLSFDMAYEKKLRIMDLTSFTMCQEHAIPIIVFNFNTKNNLQKIVMGEDVGTIINI